MRLSRSKKGAGKSELDSAKLAVVESLLPNGTSHLGPPSSKTASLAATAKMSAQETTPWHMFSNLDFMLSITSKPLRELAFGNEFFSPVKVSVSSNNTDASHP
ncbi:hypothetical protein V8G54_032953 [Vigna mungo]|uniref:Uncharacterized protein n=1 Tax=Vigna mungo TaxID=3915 RepID=A0AAQ3RJA7_VIGMU